MAPRLKGSSKGLLLLLMATCTLILLKTTLFLSSTSKLRSPDAMESTFYPSSIIFNSDVVRMLNEEEPTSELPPEESGSPSSQGGGGPPPPPMVDVNQHGDRIQVAAGRSNDKLVNNKEVFHDRDIFLDDYDQMNKTFKIYIYPHARNEPFANVLLPTSHEPGGNYASESYFKLALSTSHFVTPDPWVADLFFLPFSIASMRHDRRIGVDGIKGFVRDYVSRVRDKYPYWNRTGGADHFYIACHSIGRTAMEKALEVATNAIQVVCSSSYFLKGYGAHKDASIPQIWPRRGDRPTRDPSKRAQLAFYAGTMNSRVRQRLIQTWVNDTEIAIHRNRLRTPYSESLLGSKFCIHAKGFEVNTARVGDAIYYGCVPVVLADHYDLPFADTLNWSSFSVIVSIEDIPSLKKILKEIVDGGEYLRLQKNVLKVRDHFRWHRSPVDFDAFHMVMYELWLRRSSVRIPLFDYSDQK